MRDKQHKYKMSMGLAFNEEKEMQMLGRMAKEGWIFTSFSMLGYNFQKGKPTDLIYCMDTYKLKQDEKVQYLTLFAKAGWTHVCSVGDSIHFFSAIPGTKPIYTDQHTLVEKYKKSRNDVHRGILGLAVIIVISLVLNMLFNLFWDIEVVRFVVMMIAAASFGVLVVLGIASLVLNARIRNI